jgi:rod shape-determining protein MreC
MASTRHPMLIGKNRVIRRRAFVGLLVAAALSLLTLSYRQGSQGLVGDIQRGTLAVTAPFSAATHRVTQPFVDGWHWLSGLTHAHESQIQLQQAKAVAAKLQAELIQARRTNADLEQLTHFVSANPQFTGVSAAVSAQSFTIFQRHITIGAGTSSGVQVGDPVVAPVADGASLIGRIDSVSGSYAVVDLITDPQSAVAATVSGTSGTAARGLLQVASGSYGLFDLLDVSPDAHVAVGQTVVTAQQGGRLPSTYPAGLLIGEISSVQLNDFSSSATIQVTPYVDFSNIQDVFVLTGRSSR